MPKIPRIKHKSLRHERSSTLYKGFELVYKELALPLMKFLVKRMGGEKQAAEEVFSNTTYAALKGWHTFSHKSSYFTWICKIGLNKIADYYRSQIHEKSIIIAPLLEELSERHSDELSIEEKLILKELRINVRACLMLLPGEKRKLIYLRFYKQLTIKKIAEIFNTSERSVEGKIYRAKLELKETISLKHPYLAYRKNP